MVVEYECGRCKLKVQLGWFHRSMTESFGSASLLMCTACGAQHKVEIALRPESIEALRHANDRFRVILTSAGERPVEAMAVLRRLLGCSLGEVRAKAERAPVTLRDGLLRQEALQMQSALEHAGASVHLVTIASEGPPDTPAQEQDKLLVLAEGEGRWDRLPISGDRQGAAGQFDLSNQRCGRCRSQGTLVPELSAGPQRCPRCGTMNLDSIGGWVT